MTDLVKPTVKIASNTDRALKLRRRFDLGGTDVGVRRAEQLAGQHEIDIDDIKLMHSYFVHHAVDMAAKTRECVRTQTLPAGHIAWLLYGGDEVEE